MSDTLLVNRFVQQKEQETIKRTEVTSQRLLAANLSLPIVHRFGEPEVTTTTSSYSLDYGPKTVVGPVTPIGSSEDSVATNGEESTHLISRKKTEHTTQKITTTTKVIRELHHIGPNGEIISEDSIEYPAKVSSAVFSSPSRSGLDMEAYRTQSPAVENGTTYDYDMYSRGAAPQPQGGEFFPYPTPAQGGYHPHFRDPASGEYPPAGYGEIDGNTLLHPNGAADPYRNTPSPGIHGVPNDRYGGFQEDRGRVPEDPYGGRLGEDDVDRSYLVSRENIEQHSMPEHDIYGRMKPPDDVVMYASNGALPTHMNQQFDPQQRASAATTPMIQPSPQHSGTPLIHSSRPSSGLQAPNPIHDTYAPASLLRSPSTDSSNRVRWRDPDLHEVIDFLSNPNNIVKANAAAYLQHLCYMDDATKQKARILGGIPPLVALLSHELPELHRNACGALRNLSYGRQNDENKRSIKDAGGLPVLVRLLRKTLDNEVKELVTGVLWNMSSSEELKQSILDEALGVLVSHVVIPCSGWNGGEVERDPNNDVWWSTVFKNASGIMRNISSAGEYARSKLRHCPGFVDSLFCVVKLAIQGNSHDNKSVENCVCILRNLSYRCQEVEDPNYDKNYISSQTRATAAGKADNLGCFGGSKKKKELVGGQMKEMNSTYRNSSGANGGHVRGMELLWQSDLVVQPYLSLLSDGSNPETLEAAAGALQNLAACYWQPSIDVRAAVRKEKGLPILVELLRMEVDRVVCAVATALRNLAIDHRNKELIGKYAMKDLVQKLPSPNMHDATTSDETIAAVLATLNEVIKKNAEFSRSLLDAGGVDRLVYVTKQRVRYAPRVVKFASQVLFSMWSHQELREVYKKAGWKEQDFVSKSVAARNAAGGAHSPTANNTLNRPMASQGGTRYEDRTIQRSKQPPQLQYHRREDIPLSVMGYGSDGAPPAPGGVRLYGQMQAKPGEPVYAKVDRDKKRNKHPDDVANSLYNHGTEDWGEAPPAYSIVPNSVVSSNYAEPQLITTPLMADVSATDISPRASGQEPAGDSWV